MRARKIVIILMALGWTFTAIAGARVFAEVQKFEATKDVQKYLRKANKEFGRKKYDKALAYLDKAEEKAVSRYEQAIILQGRATYFFFKEQPEKTLEYDRQLLGFEADMPPELFNNIVKDVALVEARYGSLDEARRLADKYAASSFTKPDGTLRRLYFHIGQSSYAREDYRSALYFLDKADAQEGEPLSFRDAEMALTIKIFANIDLDQVREARELLYAKLDLGYSRQYCMLLTETFKRGANADEVQARKLAENAHQNCRLTNEKEDDLKLGF